jgi:hypothetical protein
MLRSVLAAVNLASTHDEPINERKGEKKTGETIFFHHSAGLRWFSFNATQQ